MASFVMLLIARTARIACSDNTHEKITVTLSAHARRGLLGFLCMYNYVCSAGSIYKNVISHVMLLFSCECHNYDRHDLMR